MTPPWYLLLFHFSSYPECFFDILILIVPGKKVQMELYHLEAIFKKNVLCNIWKLRILEEKLFIRFVDLITFLSAKAILSPSGMAVSVWKAGYLDSWLSCDKSQTGLSDLVSSRLLGQLALLRQVSDFVSSRLLGQLLFYDKSQTWWVADYLKAGSLVASLRLDSQTCSDRTVRLGEKQATLSA